MLEKTLKRKRWLVAAAAVGVQLCLGAIYAWSVFVTPLMEDFGWSKTEVSITFTLVLVFYAVGMLVGGRWQDAAGPRTVVTAGGILLGLGYILASRANSLLWLYLTYGVLGGIGVGLGYAGPLAACVKWFPDKRGLAAGLAVAGFGAGALVFAPVATRIIVIAGWRQAVLVLGLVFLVIVLLGARLLSDPPQDWNPGGAARGKRRAMPVVQNFDWPQMVRLRQFWILWAIFGLSTSAGLLVIGHLAAYLSESGFLPSAAAFAVGVMAVLNGGGRILWGYVSDWIGRLQALRVSILLMGGAMLVFPNIGHSTILLMVAGLVGLCFGGILSIYPSMTADFFGTAHVGSNYGILFTAYGVAGIAGPGIGAAVHDAYGSYRPAFLIFGVVCALALGLTAAARPPGTSSE